MPAKIRKLILAAMVGSMALGSTLSVGNAEASWPPSYSWLCQGSAFAQVECLFWLTNPGPAGYSYEWLFGDGSQSGRVEATKVVYYYEVVAGQEGHFDVALIGYTSSTARNPDSFIECPISFANDYGIGGGPSYSGSCQ